VGDTRLRTYMRGWSVVSLAAFGGWLMDGIVDGIRWDGMVWYMNER
jgi:hypothetical protein